MAGMLFFSSRTLPQGVLRAAGKTLRRSSSEQNLRQIRTFYRLSGVRNLSQCSSWFSALLELPSRNCSKELVIQCRKEIHFSPILSNETKDVVVPPFADSVSEGDVRWEKKVGDSVSEDETVCEIETDKTSIAVPAPGNGVIEEQYVADGTTVKAGQKLFRIKLGGGGAPSKPKEAPAAKAAPEKAAPSPPPKAAPEKAAPPPKADAAPPPPPKADAAPPTPPKGDAVPPPSAPSKPPPVPHAPKAATPPPAPRAVPSSGATVKVPPTDYTKKITGTRTEQQVKMNRMRQRIAQRLKEAQNTNAMLTTFNEIDMGNIMEFRKANLEKFQKKYGLKLGFMSAFVKASAYALQEQPVVNAVIDPTGTEIIYRDYVDISVAVATPKGLVVPVLRNVESMNFADIEMGINALGEKARNSTLAIEDMDGGTFTISNGGVFGSLLGTPIINPPQSSILGMHGIFDRPVAKNGQVIIRPMMYVALTYDHRLIDGREAVMFLRKIKDAVEDPRVILAGL